MPFEKVEVKNAPLINTEVICTVCGKAHNMDIPSDFKSTEFMATCAGACREQNWDKKKRQVVPGEYKRTLHFREVKANGKVKKVDQESD